MADIELTGTIEGIPPAPELEGTATVPSPAPLAGCVEGIRGPKGDKGDKGATGAQLN